MKDDDQVTRAIGIAHTIVNAFSQSWNKRRDLVKAQMEFSLPTHSLIMVCSLLNCHYNNTCILLLLYMDVEINSNCMGYMYVFDTGMCNKMGHKIQDITENCRARKGCADPKTAHLKLRWQDTEVMESNISALLPMSGLTQSSL